MIGSRLLNYILFAVALAALTSSCDNACRKSADHAYIFDLPFTMSPGLTQYTIGDTVRFAAEFDDNLYDVLSDQYYSYGHQTLYLWFTIRRIDTAASYNAFENFDYLFHEGDYQTIVYPDGFTTNVAPNFLNGSYRFSFDIILKHPGSYYLSLNSDITHNSDLISFPRKCAGFDIGFQYTLTTDIPDNNFNLLDEIDTELYQEGNPNFTDLLDSHNYHRFGIFILSIVE